MRSVEISELKKNLRSLLLCVKDGEEVIVVDRNTPVARISPCNLSKMTVDEKQLVASGGIRPASHEMDWDEFWSLPFPEKVATKAAIQAVLDDRQESF